MSLDSDYNFAMNVLNRAVEKSLKEDLGSLTHEDSLVNVSSDSDENKSISSTVNIESNPSYRSDLYKETGIFEKENGDFLNKFLHPILCQFFLVPSRLVTFF